MIPIFKRSKLQYVCLYLSDYVRRFDILKSKCLSFVFTMTLQRTSRNEYLVTLLSGLICIVFLILVTLYYSPNGEQNVQSEHNRTHTPPIPSQREITSVAPEPPDTKTVPDGRKCDKQNGENPAFEHAIKDAKTFEQSIKTKDTLPKRVWHRLTHREEASRAALTLTALAILLLAAIILTKMWKEKDHYALSMKNVASYPQDDKKSEILVKGKMLNSLYAY